MAEVTCEVKSLQRDALMFMRWKVGGLEFDPGSHSDYQEHHHAALSVMCFGMRLVLDGVGVVSPGEVSKC